MVQRHLLAALAAVPALALAATPAPTAATSAAAAGTASTCPPPLRSTVHRTPPTYRRTVALTFDDGPSSYTPKVLETLNRYHAKATFFETGAHVDAHPAMSRRVVAAGMKIGNHTYTHPQAVAGSSPYGSFDTLPLAVQVDQVDRTTAAIVRATGRRPCFFRAPGGHDKALATRTMIRRRGMTMVNWSISSGDSAQPGRLVAWSYHSLYRNATRNPGNHVVLLMHDGKASAEPERQVSSYRGNTIRALPSIIRWYRSRGYVFTDPAGHPF